MKRKEYKRIIKNLTENLSKITYEEKKAIAYLKPEYAKMLELKNKDLIDVYLFHDFIAIEEDDQVDAFFDEDKVDFEKDEEQSYRYCKKFAHIYLLDSKRIINDGNLDGLIDAILNAPSSVLHKNNIEQLEELTLTIVESINLFIMNDLEVSKELEAIARSVDCDVETLKNLYIRVLGFLKVRQDIYNDSPLDINPTKSGLVINEKVKTISGFVDNTEMAKKVELKDEIQEKDEKIWI